MLALNEREEAVACLRANVYFCQVGLGAGNILFENHPEAFINYPALDMTIAATHPDYYGSGFLSLLRYYMYRLHHHTVRTITGVVVNNSLLHNQLQKLGYFFLASGYQSEDLTTVDHWVLASLPADRVITALSTLRAKYAGLIHEYPLTIN